MLGNCLWEVIKVIENQTLSIAKKTNPLIMMLMNLMSASPLTKASRWRDNLNRLLLTKSNSLDPSKLINISLLFKMIQINFNLKKNRSKGMKRRYLCIRSNIIPTITAITQNTINMKNTISMIGKLSKIVIRITNKNKFL